MRMKDLMDRCAEDDGDDEEEKMGNVMEAVQK